MSGRRITWYGSSLGPRVRFWVSEGVAMASVLWSSADSVGCSGRRRRVPLGGVAALALVGAARADAGVAGALLAEQLLGAAGHLAAAQRRVRARPAVGQVHEHHLVQQLLVDLAAQVRRVHVDGAHGPALGVV